RLGLVWQPAREVAFKASWGTSFRAPSLHELYYRTIVQPSQVLDPNAPGGPAPAFPVITQGGNAGLREETAETYALSGELRPAWIPGARLTASYFHIDYKDRIRGLLDGV